MDRRRIAIFIGFLAVTTVTSVAMHYQYSSNKIVESNTDPILLMKSGSIMDWSIVLNEHPQFTKLLSEPISQPTAEEGIQSGRLIGIVSNKLKVAILLKPNSDDILRIVVGDGWLNGWKLLEIAKDQVVWRNETTMEEYRQKLFDYPEDDLLLSSTQDQPK
jgi:hypothetical protein